MSSHQQLAKKPENGLQNFAMRERRTNLVGALTEALRQEIADGRLRPGDRLPTESALGASAGVSRTVVREAVAALRAEGLVETRQGAGGFVLAPTNRGDWAGNIENATVDDIISVLEIRLAIEVEAATLAAMRRTEKDLEVLKQSLDEFSMLREQGGDTLRADAKFHEALAAATHNPRFISCLRDMGEFAFPRRHLPSSIRNTAVSDDQLLLAEQEHRAIYDGIAAGDGTIAAMAVRVHLGGSRVRYASLMRERPSETTPEEPAGARRGKRKGSRIPAKA
ncbi:Predicted D-glucarate or D-galactorate regulator, GntR family [Hyphomicrobiales bacterium]|nr:Predicted D-glucarate or D-galactorate regulator, GntR family [Hyphomicrobiales bacterium]